METSELIQALPKAEQHIHIVGATRPETLLWLVEESGENTPYRTLGDVKEFFQYSDFTHFISVYSTVSKFITDESQFERITYEMLEDDARCNVRHVEASFSAPDHIRRGLDYGLMLDAINRGIRRARRDFGIGCQLRIDLVRNYGPEEGMEILGWIEGKGDNVVSVDIGGSEEGFPPEPYEPVYKRAKEKGLHLVAHAGEASGPESVWGAVRYLDVERIGHGTSAIRDPKLMDHLRDKEITVEACPVSNVRTNVVPSVRDHPIRTFYDHGISVTVNSDDPSMFGTDMNNEYIQLHEQLGFTVSELFQISLNAVDSSFLPEKEKNDLRKTFISEYDDMVDQPLTLK
ncbi:MAG: adenosine deaminase [Candidatus Bathyarchaeota archaeon]|nr:MAG: adenosine deaminase [Candidatus Bathyarchaeota archaeon]